MKKRILAALLAVILLISALCACNTKETDGSLDVSKTESDTDPTSSEENTENSDSVSDESETEPTVELTYSEENATLLSGSKCYRVVYAESVSSITAANLRNKITTLDDNEDADYAIGTDKKLADDGSPEILLGLTNRAISSEAKDMLEGPNDYAIIISGNKIAIYAYTAAALKAAVSYFQSNLVTNEIGQVFYAQKENYIYKSTNQSESGLLIDSTPIEKYTIVIPADADEDTLASVNGIATLLIENSNKFLTVTDDTAPETDYEILIGNTNRKESKAIIEKPLDVAGDFRLGFENGKLVIAATDKTGYAQVKSYISRLISTQKAIAPANSVTTLPSEDIKLITYGSALIDSKSDGLYFHKCTTAQMTQWMTHGNDIGKNAKASTGIRFDFYTDSSIFGFRVAPNSGTKF